MNQRSPVSTKTEWKPSFTLIRSSLLQQKCACGNVAGLTKQCSECQRKNLTVQRRAANQQDGSEVPPIVHEVLNTSGQSLDRDTRTFMESRFGHDFSNVRVHTDAKAAESAQAVNALAYTVGRDVVFGAGQYAPSTKTGQKLLAHELTHVVQQKAGTLQGKLYLNKTETDSLELEAERAERTIDNSGNKIELNASVPQASSNVIQRRVRPENVSCHQTGLTNPNLTGDQAVAAITAADADAVELALRAELLLDFHLLLTQGGQPIDPEFDTILQEELGLTLTNPAHFRLIEQQRNRFRRVRETLESGYLRYICRGDKVTLVGCAEGSCGENFAFSCPGNRLVVLCQPFWDNPDERSATILHEPFHIWFDMASHETNALRRADASCFESFALRVAGREAFASCVDHTAG
ncbi:eCIS core domain-containing protein [Scytonema sp. PRP1]|uniref:eCIS core domain-containing protein n=1 Tax=Scytonema sp. PRP1 TaxID=3120513 RepID=UPI00300CE3B7